MSHIKTHAHTYTCFLTWYEFLHLPSEFTTCILKVPELKNYENPHKIFQLKKCVISGIKGRHRSGT